MGKYHLNLSTKPFPAYRIASTIMLVVFLALVAISVGQVYGYFHYSRLAAEKRGPERILRDDVAMQTQIEQGLRNQLGGSQANAKIAEVNYINDMIKRRNFCWTCLLRHIETRIPLNVHLTSLKPELNKQGQYILSISAQGKSLESLADFIDRLQDSEVFEKVNVAVESKQPESYSIVMTVPYFPERDKGAAPTERRGD